MTSIGDPADPAEVFPGGLTIWASPGLVTDLSRPDLGAIAALTVVPSLSAHTRDEHPGAELVDVIATALLGQGFELLAEFDPATLVELPILPGWSDRFSLDGRELLITEPGGVLYDGDLGPGVPDGWHIAVAARGLLVLLVSGDIHLDGAGYAGSMDAARRAGNVVAAQIRTCPTRTARWSRA
jgi:hypothetical protein